MGQKDRRILIVDDDPSVRRLFRALLSRDYAVRDAWNAPVFDPGVMRVRFG